MPPVCELKDQDTSDIFMHAGEFSHHDFMWHYLLFSEPKHPPDDHEMSDISDPCDSDVAGPGAILNDDSIDSEVAGPGATSNDDLIDVDVAGGRL